jgi:hypothetical protein
MEVVDDLVQQWNKLSKRPYRPVTFTSADASGDVIYHTDCMLTLLHDHVVCCLSSVINPEDRANLESELTSPDLNIRPYQIFEISREECAGMCANMFNLRDAGGNNTVIMSDRAKRTYTPANFEKLAKFYKVLVANIDLIEHVGGGSTRCMLAEKF